MHKDYFRVINHRELLFNDFSDRVAQLLHVELIVQFSPCQSTNIRQEILIVNTHLLFPHDSSMCLERLRQVFILSSSFNDNLIFFFLCIFNSLHLYHADFHRFTKYCNILNHTRGKISSNLCQLYYAGNCHFSPSV